MGMTTVAVQLDHDAAKRAPELIAELFAKHKDGFEERAREVRYSRESMHLQHNDDGALLLIHLEFEGEKFAELQERLVAYPRTSEFATWWTPLFQGLSNGKLLPHTEELFTWIADGH